MESYRLKVRIGDSEFEAEGDKDAVQSQFEAWKEIMLARPASPTTLPSPPPPPPVIPVATADPGTGGFDRLFTRDGQVVALSILPTGATALQDAALLILMGQKVYNAEDQVTGGRLGQGLERSGLTVDRVDRMFGEYMPSRVIRSGVRRAVRYRMTTLGLKRAEEVAAALLASVPQ